MPDSALSRECDREGCDRPATTVVQDLISAPAADGWMHHEADGPRLYFCDRHSRKPKTRRVTPDEIGYD